MEDISESADVARGTLYNHFPSKSDVLLAITGEVADEWLRKSMLEQENGGTASSAILATLVYAATWFDNHNRFAVSFYHAMREVMARHDHKSPPPTLVPKDLVSQAQDAGELTAEMRPELIGMLFDSVLRHHLVNLIRGTATEPIAPKVQRDAKDLLNRLRCN